MNSWSKTTLDEMIFGYFEGSLSQEENTRLIQYLSQHPEHYAEFEKWSQTYALRETSLEDYEIATSLIRHSPKRRYWLGGTMLLIFAGMTALIISNSSLQFQKRPEVQKPSFNKQKDQVVHRESSSQSVISTSDTKNIAPAFIRLQKKQIVTNPTDTELENEIVPAMVYDDSLSGIILQDSINSTSIILHDDSINNEELLTTPGIDVTSIPGHTKENKEKKKSRRVKINLNPGKEILKTNDNF
jgi:hypothetical protein